MKGWQAFLRDAPERVVEVIEDGPFPLKKYGGSKLTWPDKRRGLMRYKGSGGRSPKHQTKTGQAAIVYFDPSFCEGEHQLIQVPDEVRERHDMKTVCQEFDKL